jgi:hypothetical protein
MAAALTRIPQQIVSKLYMRGAQQVSRSTATDSAEIPAIAQLSAMAAQDSCKQVSVSASAHQWLTLTMSVMPPAVPLQSQRPLAQMGKSCYTIQLLRSRLSFHRNKYTHLTFVYVFLII